MKRLWWEQTSWYWELPFFMEVGLADYAAELPDRDDQLAAREQLFGIREYAEEPGEEIEGLNLESNNREAAKENIG